MDQETLVQPRRAGGRDGFAFNGEMLIISAIITVLLFLVLLIAFHIYARWVLRNENASISARVVVVADERRSGLDPEVLRAIPVSLFSAAASMAAEKEGRVMIDCAVCLSEFEEKDIVRLLPVCGHSFHIGCIDMWFHSHSTCPLCRSSVEPPPVQVEVEVAEEPSPSGSESGLCADCRHEEHGGSEGGGDAERTPSVVTRGKAVCIRIEVGTSRVQSELSQSSPVSFNRLLSFKRLLSAGRKSPRPETSGCGGAEMDLESGVVEPVRVLTPR